MGNVFPVYPVDHAVNGSTVYTTYINLAHRKDRKEQIESEFQRMGISNYVRFEAIKRSHGSLGCSLSNIEALKQGMASGADHIAIFEDDFQFFIEPIEYQIILRLLATVDYDVFCLDFWPQPFQVFPTTHSLLRRVRKSCQTGGYIVNKKYAATLLQNYELGAQLLQVYPISSFCIDVFKILIQKRDKWYCYYKKAGGQRESYSDIDKRIKN